MRWQVLLAVGLTLLAAGFVVLCMMGWTRLWQWDLSYDPPVHWVAELRNRRFEIRRTVIPDPAVHRDSMGRLTPRYSFTGLWGYGVTRTSGYTGGNNGETVYFSYTAYTAPLLPLAIVFTVLAIPFDIAWARHWLRQWRAERRKVSGRCPACGYDLRATPDRCPECGASTHASAKS